MRLLTFLAIMNFLAGLTLEPAPREVLGVSANATAEEIRAAYKKRALETHPDKGGDADHFRQVRNAYESLKTAGAASVVRLPRPPRPRFPGAASPQAPLRKAPGTPWHGPSTPSPPRKTSSKIFYGDGVDVVPHKKRKLSMEEEIDSAFSQIPTRRPGAQPVVTQRAEKVGNVKASLDRIRAMPIHELWAQLTKVSPLMREQAINTFTPDIKAKLREHLLQVRKQRPGGSVATEREGALGECEAGESDDTSSGSSSTSSGSGSSSSSTSSDGEGKKERPPVAGQKAAVRQPGIGGTRGSSSHVAGQPSPRVGQPAAAGCSSGAAPTEASSPAPVARPSAFGDIRRQCKPWPVNVLAKAEPAPVPTPRTSARRWPTGTLTPAAAATKVGMQPVALS